MKIKNSLLRPYYEYNKVYFIIAALFYSFIIPFDSILQVYLPQVMLNELIAKSSFQKLVLLIVIFELMFFLVTVCDDFFNNGIKERSLYKVTQGINCEIYEKSFKVKYKYVDNPDYFDKYSLVIKDYAEKSSQAFEVFLRLLKSFVTIFSLVTIISTSIWWIVLIVLISFMIKLIAISKINKNQINKREELVSVDRRLEYYHKLFYEKRYASELKTTTLKKKVIKHFDEEWNNANMIVKKYLFKLMSLFVFNDVVVRMTEAIILIGIANAFVTGRLQEVGVFMTIIMSVEKLNNIFYELTDIVSDYHELKLFSNKIDDFFEFEEEQSGKNFDIGHPLCIEFNNVDFSYPNSGFKIENFSLKIKKGEKVAIVGENGVGKSTLFKLLLRLYDVNSGEILINGIPITQYDLKKLRGNIGVAFQKTNIYSLNALENLSLYNDVPNLKNVEENVKMYGLQNVFDKNKATLDTMMTKEFDENGIILSEGEEQKLALARLNTKQFGLLLLDEPSSAMDPIAEYEFNKKIIDTNQNVTTIMIAHRLSSIKNFDWIVVIDNGRILESGTHEELMGKEGKYKKMFEMQAENYK